MIALQDARRADAGERKSDRKAATLRERVALFKSHVLPVLQIELLRDSGGDPEEYRRRMAAFLTEHGEGASLTLSAEDDLGRERLCRYGLRPPFSLSRFRVLRDGRISYRVKKSSRRLSRCRIMTPVECIARLCS
jgi:hypothetical protein